MIMAEKEPLVVGIYDTVSNEILDSFGNEMKDGRLTEPSGEKIYRLREAILFSKQLGRPLTEDEMRGFEI